MWPKHVLCHQILTRLTWALRPGDEGTEDEMIFKTPFRKLGPDQKWTPEI